MRRFGLGLGMALVGGPGLWLGLPLAWLWIASQVQALSGSLGAALAVAFAGLLPSIAVLVGVLTRLAAAHREARVEDGLEDLGSVPMEAVLSISAFVAFSGFVAWFFLFAGASPVPFLGDGE